MSGPGSCSRVDRLYRSLLLTRFFTRGWGNPEHMKRIFSLRRKIANREFALTCVDANHEVTLTKDRTFKVEYPLSS